MLVLVQAGGKRNNLLALFFKILLQQRVAGLTKVHLPFFRYHRHAGNVFQGNLSLGHDKVQLPYANGAFYKVRNIRPQEVAELRQDAEYLSGLCKPQFANLVLQGNYLRRFYVGCFSRCGFVKHKALKPLFF